MVSQFVGISATKNRLVCILLHDCFSGRIDKASALAPDLVSWESICRKCMLFWPISRSNRIVCARKKEGNDKSDIPVRGESPDVTFDIDPAREVSYMCHLLEFE